MSSEPIKVNLQALVGTPKMKADDPIMVQCPCHADPAASLGVYWDHAYCFATRRFFRRYESAALLLRDANGKPLWNGDPKTVERAVKLVRPKLSSIQVQRAVSTAVQAPPKPIDPALADTFHRYLLASSEALSFFKSWRGLTEETIERLCVGWTGSAFSIPVFNRAGTLLGLRFRRDDRVPQDTPKYSGLSGRNGATLYSLREIDGLQRRAKADNGDLWVWEGELDFATGHQLGLPSATMTNGAGSLARLPELVREAGLNPSRWVIATDQDEPGEQAAWELCKLLGHAAVRARWDSGYKDISAFNVAGGTVQDIRLT